ncbi:MAG TPA: farnesyl diphosphate synthase [Vicinamibacteria bacterium]|nr:farnesyl diphosphate synthase [Vicinamibacteria bacterium]
MSKLDVLTDERSFDRYRSERAARIETYLDDYLPAEDTPPATISRAVRYSLFAGGKRLRPILVIASAESVGGNLDDALPAAAALEMIHTYSLIHDDLPAMDDDSLRRGQPTSHVVFGEAIAILAGDALQTHAFRVLAAPRGGSRVPPERRLRAVAVLAEAAGASGMVGGQVADLESERRPADAETLEFIHRHKTGALIRAAAEMGALMGGANESVVGRLRQFGEEIGLAFQIVDDILDVEGSSAVLGKSPGKDEKAGKTTYPRVHGIDAARIRAKELTESALSRVAALGEAAHPLVALARRAVNRTC